MRFFYSLAIYLLAPFFFLYLIGRGFREPAYLRFWRERLGYGASVPERVCLIHAASFGEVQAAAPLIRGMRERWPSLSLVITVMTPTGRAAAEALAGPDDVVCYIPIDTPSAVRRLLGRIKPCAVVVMETEIWPILFRGCRRRRIPLFIANGRITERSLRGYQRLRRLMRYALESVAHVNAISRADADAFISLGVLPDQVTVSGNLKFETADNDGAIDERTSWPGMAASDGRVLWLAASTRDGEEAVLLTALARLREQHPELLLLLVPRHPQRFAAVYQQVAASEVVARRSANQPVSADTSVFLADSMGEMPRWLAVSDFAFVGGTLVPVGGHNVLEPAAAGIPVVVGPHSQNFADEVRLLSEAGGLVTASTEDELVACVSRWLESPDQRREAGNAARDAVTANRGALQKAMQMLESAL